MKLIHNLLPHSLKNEVYNVLTNSYFPWFWNEEVIKDSKDENTFQFTHSIYQDNKACSEYYNSVIPILWFFENNTNIKIKSIYRIKANLTTQYNMSEKDINDGVHIDKKEDNYLSLIYYVNDSDGDTLIYNNDVIEATTPKANNLLYFKSNLNHAGSFPKINKRRIVINFIVEVEY
jgi:hypothetical protein